MMRMRITLKKKSDPGQFAIPCTMKACHCGAEYETDYSASIKNHSATSIDSTHRKLTDTYKEESVDSRLDDWENDYFNPIMAVNDVPPETPDDPYDEEYRKKGILVHKFRPLRPEIQAQVETDSLLAEACGKGTCISRISEADRRAAINIEIQESIDMENRPLNNIHPTISIEVDVPTSVDRQPKFGRSAFDSHGTQRFYWEEKDQYGVYRDEQGYARDLDGNTIRFHNMDIRRVLERASRDKPSYICLPEHANLFTQTKLVPEIYTKDEINEMFYGVCGEQEKNKKLSR
ncbi:hypothetical protein F2Q69_00035712 [Brassica cretica]|uniref:Uncharacterized protein n=1 Tax=Brassica cretica TaxID=69181 RepID=A0A8S9SVV4_BRACR|nr:hypothetical protein F2Q69_00035712 [Brassica cretica]